MPLLAKRPDTGKCLVVGRSLEVIADFEHVVPGKGEIYGLPGILFLIRDSRFVATAERLNQLSAVPETSS